VTRVAAPDEIGAVPMTVPPSMKLTEPDGVPDVAERRAVKVTGCPAMAGDGEARSIIVSGD